MNPVWQREPQKPSLLCAPERTMKRASASLSPKRTTSRASSSPRRSLRVGIEMRLDGRANGAGRLEEFSARFRKGRRKIPRNSHGRLDKDVPSNGGTKHPRRFGRLEIRTYGSALS